MSTIASLRTVYVNEPNCAVYEGTPAILPSGDTSTILEF